MEFYHLIQSWLIKFRHWRHIRYIPIVDEFTYIISRDCSDESDVNGKIQKGCNAFGLIRKSLLSSSKIKLSIKASLPHVHYTYFIIWFRMLESEELKNRFTTDASEAYAALHVEIESVHQIFLKSFRYKLLTPIYVVNNWDGRIMWFAYPGIVSRVKCCRVGFDQNAHTKLQNIRMVGHQWKAWENLELLACLGVK